ncbi:hypothetical protein M409DRAFT_17115 [Zasmidium cellare ATCC 36951]|uniref:Amidohydrolase-related domain-containing protein n=1 Tax=Zasmidium cellare ATCC 36951 TaxID=1080233 RepID=A0A6A6D4W5_ZASCE|nr:uncharacterized protein M409DRAFT_17115 [Zasmidium cellare ATCC 36951]KAF2173169.1 hypothetical protein M409DRAFT_17115 [Zasmidium cellare ATCC 36951]
MDPPIINLEEHFCYSEECMRMGDPASPYIDLSTYLPGIKESLLDVGPIRIEAMNKINCTYQVISHAPLNHNLNAAQCRAANDKLAAHVRARPSRFAGFAVLLVAEPQECATELRRCIEQLGFVGALIDSHTHTGTYYDGEAYHAMFATAQDLDVPIYLHPTYPSDAEAISQFQGNYEHLKSSMIGTSAFGWHADVALHVIRLFASGLFDQYPRVKIILGHMGETIPFMLGRIENNCSFWAMERSFRTVYEENIWITTTGNWSLDPMYCILRNTSIEHIMVSADYPFNDGRSSRNFIEELKESGLVSREQLEKIAFRNAERLLKLTDRHSRPQETT